MNWFWAILIIALALSALSSWVWFYWWNRNLGPKTPFEEIKTETAEIDGWQIRYHQAGKGPHLLLLHGIGANLFCWRWILPFLNPRFNVIAMDLPGFGQSSKRLDQGYGLDEQVERVRKFLETRGVKKTYVMGNSMGGNIALWLALKYPDLVEGACVIAPATSPGLVPLGVQQFLWVSHPVSLLLNRQVMRWAHQRTVSRKDRVDDHRVEETFKTYGRNREAVRSFLMATAAIRDHRLPQALSSIKSKVLVLWGSQDKLVSRKVIDALEAALPEALSEVHIGGGHHLQEDEPEWVADKIISTFLAST